MYIYSIPHFLGIFISALYLSISRLDFIDYEIVFIILWLGGPNTRTCWSVYKVIPGSRSRDSKV